MDDQRIGRVVRALRRHHGWRQADVAQKAGCSQATISLIERGHLGHVSVPLLRAVLAEIEATLVMDIRWRGAGLERLLDDEHAVLVARVVSLLSRKGWQTRVEVTDSEYGERGSYDILAWHASTMTLLVIEVKTDLPSAEATARKLDEKTRLARKIALDQFGWRPLTVGKLLIMPATSTLRRRVDRHAIYFAAVLPKRGVEVRNWLRDPAGGMAGIWFVSFNDGSSAIQRRGARERVRVLNTRSDNDQLAA
jgi:transcriptional regulator with XRE-family HTH domain